jgi:hypothetical protein
VCKKAVFCAKRQKELKKNKCLEERCIRQFVLTVGRNAKFPSNPTEADQFTAENVIPNEDRQEDTKLVN